MRFKTLLIVITSGFILGHSDLASAKEFEFQYRKSELRSDTGTEELYSRLVSFSKDYCEYEFAPPYAVKSQLRFNRCVRRTLKEMVNKISDPTLKQIYLVERKGKTKKTGAQKVQRRSAL